MDETWVRHTVVLDVGDGDSYTLERDLGESVWRRGRGYRLRGASCPELRFPKGHAQAGETNPAGVAARARVLELMPIGSRVLTRTHKTPTSHVETLGRYVIDVQLADGRQLAEVLIAERYARPGAFVG